MLGDFDASKRELERIKEELDHRDFHQELLDTPEGYFLKTRALDLVRRLYGGSPEGQTVVDRELESKIKIPSDLYSLIEVAISLSPPMWRAVEVDADGKYVQSIVDSAMLRSQVVRWIAIPLGALALFSIGLLGIGVGQLRSYTDDARITVDEAKADFDEQRRNIDKVAASAHKTFTDAEALTNELEGRRRTLLDTVSSIQRGLDDPQSDYGKLRRHLAEEMTSLSRLKEKWGGERTNWEMELTSIQGFFEGEKQRVRNQTADAIEAIALSAAEPRSELTQLAVLAHQKTINIEEVVLKANTALARVETVAHEIHGPKSELLTDVEGLKTDLIRLTGKLKRVSVRLQDITGIVKLVEDKRTDVEKTLEHLLSARSSLDLATAIQSVLSNRMLMVLAVANVVSFLLVVIVTLLFFKPWKRANHATPAQRGAKV